MQYFHWYLPHNGGFWKQVRHSARDLKDWGITAVWLPPAYKGQAGIHDVGYGVYDLYDLGEFNQKGAVRTKYGTRSQYLNAIQALHDQGLQVYGDIVFNHKGGADRTEWVKAVEVRKGDRSFEIANPDKPDFWIEAWTEFTFPRRAGKYSGFTWNYDCFDGTDWAENFGKSGIFKFTSRGKDWDRMVSGEKGNYDYLMFSDVDMNSPEVRTEYARWGRWYLKTTGIDGIRIDAVKHIQFSFFREWLDHMRRVASWNQKDGFFAVGEYWSDDVEELHHYIKSTHGKMSLFDVPLHMKFHHISRSNGNYDLRTILDDTLTRDQPALSVPFVDNHDSQPLQALESPVDWWFKPAAYAFILLRQEGYPCVFYADWSGAKYRDKGKDGNEYDIDMTPVPHLPRLVELRQSHAHGLQRDRFETAHMIGWTRQGDADYPGSGLAAVITIGDGGALWLEVGEPHAGSRFCDALGNMGNATIDINADGWGNFPVSGGSISVWIPVEPGA
ncbi:MAG: alpha-amylase [Desulfobacteraceae bacterium]|nr:MAG: alpha-amylase [Desulfobacteraceae bacterium]